MKFWEAMRELEAGKKIRAVRWPESQFMDLSTESLICPETSVKFDWELYGDREATFSFFEMVPELKNGKRFKRPKWPDGMLFGENKYKELRINMYGGKRWDLEIQDIEATDWIEAKGE